MYALAGDNVYCIFCIWAYFLAASIHSDNVTSVFGRIKQVRHNVLITGFKRFMWVDSVILR